MASYKGGPHGGPVTASLLDSTSCQRSFHPTPTCLQVAVCWRMATKVLWAAALLAYGASTGAAMNPPGASSSSTLTLDMAPNSVDDMYHGCDVQMAKNVVKEYLPNERNTNAAFKTVWGEAEKMYDEKHKRKMGGRSNMNRRTLTREEVIAIYIFTSVSGNMHEPFNEAVRNQGSNYNNFRFHALHFYLTKAIQKLNRHQLEQTQGECRDVSRRTNVPFYEVAVDTQVRFGSFASSSMIELENSEELKGPTFNIAQFGDKTCFKIKTCMGADVSIYSRFEIEAEVLIPPYEAFKVTGVEKKSEQKDLPCEVVYTLESTGQPVSNFNCALFPELRNTNGV